ncbi:N2227-domain-containing protein [Thozetella sp. PMI_491]|nr:N2227-domain-containing protein [Thozetella sp. PMI_491]
MRLATVVGVWCYWGSIHAIIEIHRIVVTLEDPYAASESPSARHTTERGRLIKRLSKWHGSWNIHHPRHRLLEALHGFYRYKDKNLPELERWKDLYRNVSPKQRKLLERTINYSRKFDSIAAVIDLNHALCQEILQFGLDFYEIEPSEFEKFVQDREKDNHTIDRISVAQALKHFVRDWSEEGDAERAQAFPLILESLHRLFPSRAERRVQALLPGAGLGRLGHELAALGGFEVTNNEWSMFMNVAYRFMEKQHARQSKVAYPFIDSWSHHVSTANMLRSVSFPDIAMDPNAVLLVEGDFTTVFQEEGQFDAIVTHFFIDTARNLMNYLDTIHKLLKPGGLWLNLGPLLYGSGPFVQLSMEEIATIVLAMGFEFLDHPAGTAAAASVGNLTLPGLPIRSVESAYGLDTQGLVKNVYSSQFWIARKP